MELGTRKAGKCSIDVRLKYGKRVLQRRKYRNFELRQAQRSDMSLLVASV